MTQHQPDPEGYVDFVRGIDLPVRNAAFTIGAYLLANGSRLDTETRILLAGVRDCLHDVSRSARKMHDR